MSSVVLTRPRVPCRPGGLTRPQCQRNKTLRTLATHQHDPCDPAARRAGAAADQELHHHQQQQQRHSAKPLLRHLAARFTGAGSGKAAASPFRRSLGASLCIGAGVSGALNGGGGGLGGGGSGGGGGGGGGGNNGGWASGGGGSGGQVLGDLALGDVSVDGAAAALTESSEECVIILDVSGAFVGGPLVGCGGGWVLTVEEAQLRLTAVWMEMED